VSKKETAGKARGGGEFRKKKPDEGGLFEVAGPEREIVGVFWMRTQRDPSSTPS